MLATMRRRCSVVRVLLTLHLIVVLVATDLTSPSQPREHALVNGHDDLDIPLSLNYSAPEVDVKAILESTYTKYLGKGCKLYSMLKQEIPVPSTSYLASQDLRDWGWRTKRDHSDRRIRELMGSFAPALQDLGLGVTGADNVDLQVTHEGSISKGAQYKVSTTPLSHHRAND